MALEQSMVLPPPTARMTSIFSSLQIFAPAYTLSMRGLGSMPESSCTSKPLSSDMTLSYSPVFLMLPPP